MTPFFYPVEGGVEKHVLNLSKELVRMGHEVDVYTSNGSWEGRPLEKSSVVEGLRVRRFKAVMSLGQFGKVWPGFAPALISGGYDVIHSHVFRHPHTDISNLASKVSGSTSVLTSHSPFHPQGTRHGLAEALVPVYDSVIARVSLNSFDRIISLTLAEKEALSSLSGDGQKIRIIPHGVDPEHFIRVSTDSFLAKFGLSGKQVVLYLGRIHPTKGVHTLIEAFAEVAPAAKDAVLVLAGPCSKEGEGYLAGLKALVNGRALQGRGVFTSRLSEEEKRAAYESCSFFVLPSSYEPNGIVLLEAAAHGKPLLSSRTDGPSSIVREGESGYLFPPGDVKELARLLGLLISDDRLRSRMGASAREMASHHRWDRVGQETVDAYLSA